MAAGLLACGQKFMVLSQQHVVTAEFQIDLDNGPQFVASSFRILRNTAYYNSSYSTLQYMAK